MYESGGGCEEILIKGGWRGGEREPSRRNQKALIFCRTVATQQPGAIFDTSRAGKHTRALLPLSLPPEIYSATAKWMLFVTFGMRRATLWRPLARAATRCTPAVPVWEFIFFGPSRLGDIYFFELEAKFENVRLQWRMKYLDLWSLRVEALSAFDPTVPRISTSPWQWFYFLESFCIYRPFLCSHCSHSLLYSWTFMDHFQIPHVYK